MEKIVNKTKAFLADEQGAETVEWVMIAAVLAAIITFAFWGNLKEAVNDAITAIGVKMKGPTS